jgi:DNA-directed RNA polymerase beta' subunit
MKIDIASIEKFIEVNECPQVTNPIFLDATRHPTSDGLFAYELFGLSGSYDRKTIFGYIDLKKPFLHPVVYKLLTSMDKRIAQLISGAKYFKVVNGEFVEDEEQGETGIKVLFENWDKLKFRRTGSSIRDDKIDLLAKLKKEEIFTTKWLVIPAFYRDINMAKISSGKISVDEINNLYAKLLNACSAVEDDTGFDFMGAMTENRVQLLMVEIYNELTQALAKKNGMIRRFLMGKSIDYATRAVISAPRINSTDYQKQKIDFIHTGVPLSHMCNLFFPFFVKEIQDFLKEEFESVNFIYMLDDPKKKPEPGNMKRVYLKNPMEDYSLDAIKKYLNMFIKSPEDRFHRLYVNTDEGKLPLTLYYEDLGREFTLTDLLYIVGYNIAQKMHVYVTRYPIEHYQNIYATRIFLLSTYKTKMQKIGNRWFEDYPDIYLDYPISENPFIDTMLLNNSYLAALGGDYDGDMVSIRGVYSQEANEEAEGIIFSKKNVLDANGKNIRKLGKESILTLYALTKE